MMMSRARTLFLRQTTSKTPPSHVTDTYKSPQPSSNTDSCFTDPSRPEPSSPASHPQPPTPLCLQLSHCIDAFHTELQNDPCLATISNSLDLMRLQMLIVGLASGINTACDLYQCYVERQRLKHMGITTVHIDAAVEAFHRSMRTAGIPQADQDAAMHHLITALPPFRQAALQHADPTHNAVVTPHPCPTASTCPASPHEAAAIASLGSKQLLTLAVNLFFRKVMADPSLSPFFSTQTPHALRPKLVSFLAFSLGINHQSVEELQAVHAPLLPRGLSMAHYDAVLDAFLSTLQQLRVDQALVNAARVNLTAMRVVFVDLLERAGSADAGA